MTISGHGQDASVMEATSISIFGAYGGSTVTLNDFTIYGVITSNEVNDLTVDGVEVDALGNFDSVSVPLGIMSYNSKNVVIRNSYVHNGRTHGGSGQGLINIIHSGNFPTDPNVIIESTTVSNAMHGITISNVQSDTTLDVIIKNSTFSNIISDDGTSGDMTSSATGILTYADTTPSTSATTNLTTINNTFGNISNTHSGSVPAAAIRDYASGSTATINHTMQNNLFASGDGGSVVNYAREINSGGTINLTSLGGSLSSDGSLSTWLNQSTDKHNQTSLASFLGILGDNGGPVPTLALLSGSPAIDSGTNASTYVSTDARGIARPQGLAYDSGAYEVLGDSDGGSNSDSGSVYVSTPGGNDGNSGSSVDVSGIPTIAVRPTFSGTTTPNSNVLVTVNSNPVTCSTVSDSNGNWSCTLPSDVEPGTHTVLVEVRDPDTNALLHTYGPYTVNVLGDSTTIDSNSELANTGVSSTLTVVASMVSGLLGVGGIILNKLRKLKDQARYVGR
ncbi:hypothetical protein KC867_01715 [Candidatus Saccharibacteria bacterium]|nr:hypothetical protein [Candidatus Saccharibacteria bacterium]